LATVETAVEQVAVQLVPRREEVVEAVRAKVLTLYLVLVLEVRREFTCLKARLLLHSSQF
jgi:hypothetical protein